MLKNLKLILCFGALCLAGLGTMAQEQKGHEGHQHQAPSEAEQQAWMDFMTPGPEQAILASYDGKWNYVMKMWEQPGAEPSEYHGKAENQMVLGGRYQKSVASGNYQGMPFEGIGFTGYDKERRVWIGTWMDTFGTSITYTEGAMDQANKLLVMKGKMSIPGMGALDFRMTTTCSEKDKQVMTMYMTMGGQEFKNMEMTFTRAE